MKTFTAEHLGTLNVGDSFTTTPVLSKLDAKEKMLWSVTGINDDRTKYTMSAQCYGALCTMIEVKVGKDNGVVIEEIA